MGETSIQRIASEIVFRLPQRGRTMRQPENHPRASTACLQAVLLHPIEWRGAIKADSSFATASKQLFRLPLACANQPTNG
ncbi:hypothetical protein [Kingella oralis]|uniref:hypothetical protein n=1 Tax=Kingella oralis TaxID=505 RepID=UPI0002DFD19C|nr:hypothetical protein [Kingella oralis]QMT42329.1 hypothetical protein H3L93_10075 [Kingella oralis]